MKIEISDNKKWHQSLTVKIMLLGVLGVFLLIPLEMIKSIIKERQKNSEDVKKEIASQWAGPQNITGPVLNIPAWIYPSRKDAEPYKTIFHIMPETLNITGNINTETRHRSIYKAAVYSADLSLTGDFLIPEMNTGERTEILWDEEYYSVGISDNRGLKGSVNLEIDSARLEAVPGLKDADVFKSGITFTAAGNEHNMKIHYSMNFRLSGSQSLTFSPVGKSTEVHLRSSWQSPGFTGNFLPAERTVDKSGFTRRMDSD